MIARIWQWILAGFSFCQLLHKACTCSFEPAAIAERGTYGTGFDFFVIPQTELAMKGFSRSWLRGLGRSAVLSAVNFDQEKCILGDTCSRLV